MTNQFERARDLRQLRYMLSTIDAYKSGSSSYPRLVEDLEVLLHSVSDANPPWREQFHAAWTVLEERYTLVLERGQEDVDETAATFTAQAVERLNGLVTSEIERLERAG